MSKKIVQSHIGNQPVKKTKGTILTKNIVNISTYAIQKNDLSKLILINASISNVRVNLPDVTTIPRDFTVWIKKIDPTFNLINIRPSNGQTINQSNILTLNSQFSTVGITSTGAEWIVFAVAGFNEATTTKAGVIEYATEQEVADMILNNKAISPANVFQFFNGSITPSLPASFTTNGYSTLPGDLIIQWGQVNVPTGNTPFSFPITFPNGVLQGCVCRGTGYSNMSVYGQATGLLNLTRTGGTIRLNASPNGGFVRWYVLGY